MKKLSKKQKLIAFIAILLVAVIVATVITTSIIKNNNQVANEGYSASTANANSNSVASYIKSGITIGGITGTLESLNTFDATANAEDIIWGETAYVKGKKITGTKVITVEQGKKSQKAFEENTILIDDYGNRVKVPVGFKIAEDSATTVTGGVVIEDVSAGDGNTQGSQFVWVPVGKVITDDSGSTTEVILGRYNYSGTLVQLAENYADETKITTGDFYYQELLKTTSSGNAKAKDIGDFATKSLASGGYYIGRYELGDATGENRNIETKDTNPVTCKSGVYPYNYITQSQASSLCQEMYSSSNFESDLINSYAWDTAIVFIQKFSGDTDYSQQIRLQTTLAKCGEAHSGSNYDVRCNIYDMAGNTFEWNTEYDSFNPCVNRGGSFNYTNFTTASRNPNSTTNNRDCYSARPILYL